MDANTKELVAIGASVASRCQACLTHHLERARTLGIDAALIDEAVAVGRMVDGGAGKMMNEFVRTSTQKSAGGSCCGSGGCC